MFLCSEGSRLYRRLPYQVLGTLCIVALALAFLTLPHGTAFADEATDAQTATVTRIDGVQTASASTMDIDDTSGSGTLWYSPAAGKYWFEYDRGGFATGWSELQIGTDYGICHFDKDGWMKIGWQYIDGDWYYFKKEGQIPGALAFDWQKIGGNWYFLDPEMLTGWWVIDDSWYWFDGSGAMATGWRKIAGTWSHFDASGRMSAGWLRDGGSWYHLTDAGAMQTGWQRIGGDWYWFDASGRMATGWREIAGTWSYFDASGRMQADTWIGDYYVDADGAWVRGKVK